MRILIIRISALGDAIHTLPALDVLKKSFPHAHIDWLIQQKIAGIVQHVPGLHKIYILNNQYLNPAHLTNTMQLLKTLRQNHYDLIIDFQGLCKTSLLVFGIDAPSIGFGWATARESISSLVHTYIINPARTSTIIEKNTTLAHAAINLLRNQPIILPQSTAHTPLTTSPQAGAQARASILTWLTAHKTKRLILLAPNTTWLSKHWPIIRWQELVSELAMTTVPNHTVVLLGQNFGTQGHQLAAFIQQHNLPIVIAPPWTLEEIFAVMPYASAIVAPDTGLLHIADSKGIPTIGIYGPTLANRHGPLITPSNRMHCFQVNCPHKYEKTHAKPINPSDVEDCMLMLKADDVAKRILKITSERCRA